MNELRARRIRAEALYKESCKNLGITPTKAERAQSILQIMDAIKEYEDSEQSRQQAGAGSAPPHREDSPAMGAGQEAGPGDAATAEEPGEEVLPPGAA